MENTSKVNIFLRLRPPNIWETSSPMKTYINYDKSTKKMFILENQPYIFDKIFYSNSNNKEIFYNLESNVEHLLNGYNNCILAYGQSGAGKTYTMGFNDKDEKSHGLISLSLDSLFQKMKEKQETATSDVEYSVSVSYIEIYNEKVYDLLSEKSSDSIHTKGTKYAGSTKVQIQNSPEAKQLLLKGNKNRHVRATTMNAASSRSHAMFTIMLSVKSDGSERSSVLHLVDLAGSEGLRKTNHSGIAQQEGVHINQGLLAVGKVVQALSSGKNLVPYRDSILTTVLLDCLNLESFFTLIACISPARKNRTETISSIRFAQSCKSLENKMLPEMNEFLKEKQRLEARTPLKPYMRPTTKNDIAKTPGRISSLKPPLSTIKKPAVPNRCNSFVTPSAKKAPVSKARYTDLRDFTALSSLNQSHAPKESIDNNTFNIMNMSCSTEVDGPTASMSCYGSATNLANFQAAPVTSFSPFMRRIEETMDKKLSAFMESFRNETVGNIEPTVVCQQVKDVVKSGIEEARRSLNEATFEITSAPAYSTLARNPTSSQDEQNSPEVEEPTASMSHYGSTTNLANFQAAPVTSFSPLMRRIEETFDKKLSALMESFRNETAANIEPTVVHQQVKDIVEKVRRSFNESTFEITSVPVCSTIARKSTSPQDEQKVTNARRTNRRLLTIDLTQASPFKANEENKENEVQAFTAVSPAENKTVIQTARRSIRILDRTVMENKSNKAVNVDGKVSRPVKGKVIKNQIVATYYGQATRNITKVTKHDHKAAIMEMLNTGSVKDLQLLPTIGAKTAYQIVSTRMVKGKFKTLNEVKKALMMKDKAWEKFLEKNLLK